MKAQELIKKYIEFFKKKDHKEIENSSLIPEHDPTVLFTTAGMHPLVPFLLGQKHPAGKRLVNVQKCIRTGDIDLVGEDPFHLSFIEMLGNWSLGDYWKEDAIKYSYEFLIKILKINPKKLYITLFKGDKDAPKDKKSEKIWLSLGIKKDHILFYPKKDNWWGPAGNTGPCGPDTEMFIDTGIKKCSKNCKPGCSCGKYSEIWNDVFMQYFKWQNKAILVDAIHCLINKKDKKVNKELAKLVGMDYPGRVIVVTNANPKVIKEILKDWNFHVFSLEKKPDKTDPKYFRELLKNKKYNLKPNEVVYFDHKEDNIKSAQEAGIMRSILYKNNKQIKKFLNNNKYYYEQLKEKNVDTGMGVERTIAILQNKKSVYETEVFSPIMNYIKKSSKKYNEKSTRIIADHLKAAVFILAEGITPSNLDQGYILRRFIRRSIRHLKLLKSKITTQDIAKIVMQIYKNRYKFKEKFILEELKKEEERFSRTLEKGLNRFNKIARKKISGKDAFLLFQSYGFPLEMTMELAKEKKIKVDEKSFEKEYKKHQELSKKGISKKFKGGLVDASYETTKLHTASHLLLYALRKVLNKNIMQRGSNITPERLRFDFNFDRKLTDKEIKKIEDIVNKMIKKKIPVVKKEMTVKEAKKLGAKSEFTYKTDKVFVYIIKDCVEICMGPHVKNTKELGKFKIIKEESSSAGVRRIRAILE